MNMSKLENQDVLDLSKSKDKPTIMEYVGKNCGALSLMIAVIAPIVSIFLTLMIYSYYHGYYGYFKVSDIWLDLSNKSKIYNLIFMIFVSLAIMALNVIPILLSKYKKVKGLIIGAVIGIVVFFIFVGLLFLSTNKNIFGQALTIWLVMYGIGLIDSISNFIVEKINDKRNKSSKSKISRSIEITIGIIVIAICLIADVIICYFTGISVADSEKEFKIIEYNEGYAAVLNESNDNFVISEVDWDKDTNQLTIYANEQTVIDNKDVPYKIVEFSYVNVHE